MGYYQDKLESEFVGKTVAIDIQTLAESDSDFDWESFDADLNEGEGVRRLNYRPYLSDDDEDEEEEYEFREEENWSVQTGVEFSVSEDSTIENIQITAEIYAPGDSGLGECDPEEEWDGDDLEAAREFFGRLTDSRKE